MQHSMQHSSFFFKKREKMVKVFSTASNPQQTNLFSFKKKESSLTKKLNAYIEKQCKISNIKPFKVHDYQYQPARHVHNTTMTVEGSDPDFPTQEEVIKDGQLTVSPRSSNPVGQTLNSVIDPALLASPHFLSHSPQQTFQINQSSSNIQAITFPDQNNLPFDPSSFFPWNPELSFFADPVDSPRDHPLALPPPPPPPSSPVESESTWGENQRNNQTNPSFSGGEIDELNSLYQAMKLD